MLLLALSGIIILILLLLNFFLYRTAVRLLEIRNDKIKKALAVVLAILGVSFLPASMIAFQYYNLFTRIFYIISAAWLGFFLYFFLAAVLCRLLYLFVRKHPGFPMRQTALALFALGALTGIFGIVNAAFPCVTSVEVALPNLPVAWENRTAVWVSDSHFGQVWNDDSAARLASLIKAQHPDVVFIGGDFYDGVAADYSGLAQKFSNLASQGTYYITGNHEEFAGDLNNSKYLKAISDAGIVILNNRLIDLNGLQIIGVDYDATRNPLSFKNILQGMGIDHVKPSILLKHTPFDLAVSREEGISLQISGHTHEGQIFPGNILTHLIYAGYDYGLKSYGAMQVLTSSGAGTWGPPMRVGTIPEIVKITFVRK